MPETKPKRGRGPPPKEIPQLDASPKKIARAVFSAVKRPDPKLRIARKRTVAAAS